MGNAPFNLCFVLVSGGNDLYPEMAFISISLARRVCPGSRVTILTDEHTRGLLTGRNRETFDLGDKVVVVPTGLDDLKARSRFVKTSMREAMDPGPFVFLDADALAVRSLSGIEAPDVAVAGVPDRNLLQPYPHCPTWVRPIYERFGWRYPVRHYLNSGVLFINDSPAAWNACSEWHRRWRLCYQTHGVREDQPSLNSVLCDYGTPIRALSPAFNAVVEVSPWSARRAAVFHFYVSATLPDFSRTLLGHLIQHRRATGRIDWDAVESAGAQSDPWIHPTNSVWFELATRHYRSAARIFGARLVTGYYLRNRAWVGRTFLRAVYAARAIASAACNPVH